MSSFFITIGVIQIVISRDDVQG